MCRYCEKCRRSQYVAPSSSQATTTPVQYPPSQTVTTPSTSVSDDPVAPVEPKQHYPFEHALRAEYQRHLLIIDNEMKLHRYNLASIFSGNAKAVRTDLPTAPVRSPPRQIFVLFGPSFPSSSRSQIIPQIETFFQAPDPAPRFSVTEISEPYESFIQKHPTDIVFYLCFTTGTRYAYDLPPSLGSDTRSKKVFLLSVYTGAMNRSSAVWSSELTVFNIFTDESHGILYETSDMNEKNRIAENKETLLNLRNILSR